uniref:LEM domain-containing protein n=1 Tax=Panagrolaimus sp. PS1159 TaxID=55785 RepID=A0AC35FAL7_9BILA
MSNIYDELSNEELREELLQRGFPNAPITSETRKVYIRKLMNLTASGDADFNAPPHLRPLIDFAITDKTTNDMPSVEEDDVVILEDTPHREAVEKDSNEDAATSFNHESDESHCHETSRILTPEESRHVFISSMEHRRKIVKSAPSRIPKILIFVVFVLLTATKEQFINKIRL